MNPKIRVLHCDDHTLFRAGLKALRNNESELEVVGPVGAWAGWLWTGAPSASWAWLSWAALRRMGNS